MTDNGVGLRNGIGCRLGGAEARDQAGERNRISGGKRNNALLQRPLGECDAHNQVPQASFRRLAPMTNSLAAKKFPHQPESPPDNPRQVFGEVFGEVLGDARLPEKCLTYNVALLVALPSSARRRGLSKAIDRRPALIFRIS